MRVSGILYGAALAAATLAAPLEADENLQKREARAAIFSITDLTADLVGRSGDFLQFNVEGRADMPGRAFKKTRCRISLASRSSAVNVPCDNDKISFSITQKRNHGLQLAVKHKTKFFFPYKQGRNVDEGLLSLPIHHFQQRNARPEDASKVYEISAQ